MEVPAGAVPLLPYFQQAASVILQKLPFIQILPLACTFSGRWLSRGCFMPFAVSEHPLLMSCSQCLQPSTAISLPNEPFIYITRGMFGLHQSN